MDFLFASFSSVLTIVQETPFIVTVFMAIYWALQGLYVISKWIKKDKSGKDG